MVRVQYVQASVHPTGDITETLGCQYLAVHVLSVSLVCPLSLILRVCLSPCLHRLWPRLLLLPPSRLDHWNSRTAKSTTRGTSLAVQWVRLCAPTAGGIGSIPGRGTEIPNAGIYH